LAIVKVLLPLIDIKQELKLKSITTLATCVKWLGEIGRGMNWDEHMDEHIRDYRCKLIEDRAFVGLDMHKDSAALFEIGGV
jgi:hypothetical protein